MIYTIIGKIPQDIELVHALTRKLSSGRLELTGDIYKFETHRSLKDILKMKVRIKKAWLGIQEMCEQELL